MFTFEALQFLLFLIPGFISAGILNILTVRQEKKDLSTVAEALIFSLVIYFLYSFISGVSPVSFDETTKSISYNPKPFLWLVSLSIAVPMLFSLFITHDWHMKLARRLRISRRTSRSSVWFDVFADVKRSIIINFADGRQLFGWPLYYSDDPSEPYIFLLDPAWIKPNDTTGDLEFVKLDALEGILVTPNQEIDSIEFLREEQPASGGDPNA